jgi:hypothetical protein
MRIGFAFVVGMIALIALGYLVKYSQDASAKLEEQARIIADLNAKLKQSGEQAASLQTQFSACSNNLNLVKEQLAQAQAELGKRAQNICPANPSINSAIYRSGTTGPTTLQPCSQAAAADGRITWLGLDPLYLVIAVLGLMLFGEVLLGLRWYFKVYRRSSLA